MLNLKMKILVVDDFASMREVVTTSLKELGFSDIITADDGHQAWSKMMKSSIPIGLIISDWNMPKCTGLEFLKKIRAADTFSKTPFIMLTTEDESELVMEAIQAGVSNYMMKPVSVETLKKKIESTFQKLSQQIKPET